VEREGMSQVYRITLKVKRYDPDTKRAWVQGYELEAGRILRLTDVFRKINNELDPTLAWNSSCEHAQCGSCAVRVNGKPLLACELLVENAIKHFGCTTFTIEPLTIAPVVRDLIVDFDKAYERVNKVKPYIIDPHQGQRERVSTGYLLVNWNGMWKQLAVSIVSVVPRHVSAAIRTFWVPMRSWPALSV